MDKFELQRRIGSGSYAAVWRGKRRADGRIVAIKQLLEEVPTWDATKALPEVAHLSKLRSHPNVIRLYEVVRVRTEVFLVFENCDGSLYDVMQHRLTTAAKFSEEEIRWVIRQILAGLAYCHGKGVMHRDLKPENILVSNEAREAKLCDFGQAKLVKSKPPCTSYIATRWYRAPETILKASRYGAEVDMWAVGTLMAELFTLRPIFAGSSELDQVFKITTTLGTPTHWKEGLRLAEQAGYSLPSASGLGLRSVVPQAGPDALTFMGELLQFDPSRRLTAREALSHRFMQGPVTPFVVPKQPAKATDAASARELVQRLQNNLPALGSSSSSSGGRPGAGAGGGAGAAGSVETRPGGHGGYRHAGMDGSTGSSTTQARERDHSLQHRHQQHHQHQQLHRSGDSKSSVLSDSTTASSSTGHGSSRRIHDIGRFAHASNAPARQRSPQQQQHHQHQQQQQQQHHHRPARHHGHRSSSSVESAGSASHGGHGRHTTQRPQHQQSHQSQQPAWLLGSTGSTGQAASSGTSGSGGGGGGTALRSFTSSDPATTSEAPRSARSGHSSPRDGHAHGMHTGGVRMSVGGLNFTPKAAPKAGRRAGRASPTPVGRHSLGAASQYSGAPVGGGGGGGGSSGGGGGVRAGRRRRSGAGPGGSSNGAAIASRHSGAGSGGGVSGGGGGGGGGVVSRIKRMGSFGDDFDDLDGGGSGGGVHVSGTLGSTGGFGTPAASLFTPGGGGAGRGRHARRSAPVANKRPGFTHGGMFDF